MTFKVYPNVELFRKPIKMLDVKVKESLSEVFSASSFVQIEMASGKVLEETYRKWVQYKEDCAEMIENEPLLQGMEEPCSYNHHAKRNMTKGEKGEKIEQQGNCETTIYAPKKFICDFFLLRGVCCSFRYVCLFRDLVL